jgi:hypothetical protein
MLQLAYKYIKIQLNLFFIVLLLLLLAVVLTATTIGAVILGVYFPFYHAINILG